MVREKAQVTLEACLIFVAIVLFLFGIIQTWLWLDTTMADRAKQFNNTRVAAAEDPDRQDAATVDTYFNSRLLTEEWVFDRNSSVSLANAQIGSGDGVSGRIPAEGSYPVDKELKKMLDERELDQGQEIKLQKMMKEYDKLLKEVEEFNQNADSLEATGNITPLTQQLIDYYRTMAKMRTAEAMVLLAEIENIQGAS